MINFVRWNGVINLSQLYKSFVIGICLIKFSNLTIAQINLPTHIDMGFERGFWLSGIGNISKIDSTSAQEVANKFINSSLFIGYTFEPYRRHERLGKKIDKKGGKEAPDGLWRRYHHTPKGADAPVKIHSIAGLVNVKRISSKSSQRFTSFENLAINDDDVTAGLSYRHNSIRFKEKDATKENKTINYLQSGTYIDILFSNYNSTLGLNDTVSINEKFYFFQANMGKQFIFTQMKNYSFFTIGIMPSLQMNYIQFDSPNLLPSLIDNVSATNANQLAFGSAGIKIFFQYQRQADNSRLGVLLRTFTNFNFFANFRHCQSIPGFQSIPGITDKPVLITYGFNYAIPISGTKMDTDTFKYLP